MTCTKSSVKQLEMSNEVKIEVEVVEHLRKVCRTLRANRVRPELAIPAAQWETKLNSRLEELKQAEMPRSQRLAEQAEATPEPQPA